MLATIMKYKNEINNFWEQNNVQAIYKYYPCQKYLFLFSFLNIILISLLKIFKKFIN